MIRLQGVTLAILQHGAPRVVLRDCDFRFADSRMLVIAADPQWRAAVLGALSGQLRPQRGAIRRDGRVSWAIGPAGPFRSALTGADTVAFFCDVYGLRRAAIRALVADLVEGPPDMSRPVIQWPVAQQVQLAYALALAPDFDIYLLNGPLRLAYREFDSRWRPLFEDRVRDRQLIVATAQTALALKVARVGALLEDGALRRVTDPAERLRALAAAAPDEPDSAAAATDEEAETEVF